MSKAKGEIPTKYTHCHYCEQEFLATQYELSRVRRPTRDHFVPRSKKGKQAVFNIFIVCQLCNTLKGDFLPEEFIYWLSCKIKWEEFPSIHGVTYNIELLKTVKKNVSAIYNGEAVTDLEDKVMAVPILQKKKDRKIKPEYVEKDGVHYCNYLGTVCPCVGFIDRAISSTVKQYQNAYYHAGEEKYVFVTPAYGIVAYYKKSIEKYIKPFYPDKAAKILKSVPNKLKELAADVTLSVNNNTSRFYIQTKEEDPLTKWKNEPEQNFHTNL